MYSTLKFSRKLIIFQKVFFIQLSQFLILGSNLKYVKKKLYSNFSSLTCHKIKLFSKKINEKQFLKINYTFYVN